MSESLEARSFLISETRALSVGLPDHEAARRALKNNPDQAGAAELENNPAGIEQLVRLSHGR